MGPRRLLSFSFSRLFDKRAKRDTMRKRSKTLTSLLLNQYLVHNMDHVGSFIFTSLVTACGEERISGLLVHGLMA